MSQIDEAQFLLWVRPGDCCVFAGQIFADQKFLLPRSDVGSRTSRLMPFLVKYGGKEGFEFSSFRLVSLGTQRSSEDSMGISGLWNCSNLDDVGEREG